MTILSSKNGVSSKEPLVHFSIQTVKHVSFLETTIIVWDLAEVLHAYFLCLTQNIKKMCQTYKDDIKTSGLRFNKIKGF